MKTTEKKITISRGFAFAPGCLGGTDFNQRIQAYSALLTQWQTPLLETRKQNINRGKANQTETHIYQSETCKYSILNDSKGSNATWHRLQQKQLQYRLTYFRKGLSNWGELRVFYFLDLRSVEKVNIFLTQADPSRTMSVPLIKVPHAWWIFRVKKKKRLHCKQHTTITNLHIFRRAPTFKLCFSVPVAGVEICFHSFLQSAFLETDFSWEKGAKQKQISLHVFFIRLLLGSKPGPVALQSLLF